MYIYTAGAPSSYLVRMSSLIFVLGKHRASAATCFAVANLGSFLTRNFRKPEFHLSDSQSWALPTLDYQMYFEDLKLQHCSEDLVEQFWYI